MTTKLIRTTALFVRDMTEWAKKHNIGHCVLRRPLRLGVKQSNINKLNKGIIALSISIF